MIKTLMLVSLSAGMLGEGFVRHEVELGLSRLKDYGLNVKYASHAKCGMEYLNAHPEARAQDLLEALSDPEVDMIMTDIGGSETYRLLPYLFANGELAKAACDKVFLGFSDTTVNHLMLHKVGMRTFYGQAFLPDVCDPGPEMLPYTRHFLEELLSTGTIREVRPSKTWYESRPDFSEAQLGVEAVPHPDAGWEMLQGNAVFSGEILGGCIETLSDLLSGWYNADAPELVSRYQLFPTLEEWAGKILLLESSEDQAEPDCYREMLMTLKDYGLFDVVSGVLVGRPMDGKYAEEYRQILLEVIEDPELPILFNLHIGHGTPRCIIPFGVPAVVDGEKQVITFSEDLSS